MVSSNVLISLASMRIGLKIMRISLKSMRMIMIIAKKILTIVKQKKDYLIWSLILATGLATGMVIGHYV